MNFEGDNGISFFYLADFDIVKMEMKGFNSWVI